MPVEEQKFFVPADQLGYLHKLARDLTKGPGRILARIVARLKCIITFHPPKFAPEQRIS